LELLIFIYYIHIYCNLLYKRQLIVELLKLQVYVNDYENQNRDNNTNNNGRTNSGRFSYQQQRNSLNNVNVPSINYFSSSVLDLNSMKSENQILYYQLLYILCYCLNDFLKVEVK